MQEATGSLDLPTSGLTIRTSIPFLNDLRLYTKPNEGGKRLFLDTAYPGQAAGQVMTLEPLVDQPASVAYAKGVSVYNLVRMRVFSDNEVINAGYSITDLLARPNVNDDGIITKPLHDFVVSVKARVYHNSDKIVLYAADPGIVPGMTVRVKAESLTADLGYSIANGADTVSAVDGREITLATLSQNLTQGPDLHNADLEFFYGIKAASGSTGTTVALAASAANSDIKVGMIMNDDALLVVQSVAGLTDDGGNVVLSNSVTVTANESLQFAFPPNFTLLEILGGITTFKDKGLVDADGDLHNDIRTYLRNPNATLKELKNTVKDDADLRDHFETILPTAGFNFENLINAQYL